MFTVLEKRVTALEQHADSMIAWRKSVEENTEVQREVVAVGRDIIAAVKVLGWLGKTIKFIASVGAAIVIIVAAIKGFFH